jgi:hypothetical protein
VAKKNSKSCGDCVAAKTQESSVNHTTRLYGVQEAICIYRRDLDNMPGSRRQYLNPMEEDTEFMFLTNAISLSGTALAYPERLRETQLIDP